MTCGQRYVELYPQRSPKALSLLSRLGVPRLTNWLSDRRRVRRRLFVPGDDTAGYRAEIAEFLAAVAEDRSPASDGFEGRRDLEIVLAGYRSLDTGTWTDVPAYDKPNSCV